MKRFKKEIKDSVSAIFIEKINVQKGSCYE